jgi:hypothetical protein
MSDEQLNSDTITFGKYKNGTLLQVLRDRSYCVWLLKQDWFQTNYEYLHNRVQEYEPLPFFFQKTPDDGIIFLDTYQYFYLTPVDEINLYLSDNDKICYIYYLKMVSELKTKVQDLSNSENPYNIKAPCRWLIRFEKETDLKRTVFKDFINAHELLNIPYIVERIKKEGGIEYKGAQSFNIAKKRSLEQENYWENILKDKYGEGLGIQFKYEKCIFDFITISTNTIYECKLALKDFNEEQHKKYVLTLEKYRIIYLIGYDCVISMERKTIYTSNVDKYQVYQMKIPSMTYSSSFDELIKSFDIVEIEDLSTLFGKSQITDPTPQEV